MKVAFGVSSWKKRASKGSGAVTGARDEDPAGSPASTPASVRGFCPSGSWTHEPMGQNHEQVFIEGHSHHATREDGKLSESAAASHKAIKYSLSVTGVHSCDDESMFEKAYDAKAFRHEAADVLQSVGPRVGAKNEAVDTWVHIAATKVEVIFRRMMKEILTAGRQSNDKERAVLREWLDDRDARILSMQQERDQAVQELQEVRKEMACQAELIGRSATEVFQHKEEQQQVQRELAEMRSMQAEYELRERQFVDSLSHCRRQIEEREAQVTQLNKHIESALQERSDSSKQYEQVDGLPTCICFV